MTANGRKAALVVEACGPMTTLQDVGRIGSQRFGVSASGAMDRLALAAANALVGNGPGAAAIEFTLLGGAFTAEGGPVLAAVAGAPCAVTLGARPVPAMMSVLMEAGQRLAVGPAQSGVFAYLAVAGGFDVAPQLGSLSLQPRAGIGGFQGRPFRPGDRVPLLLSEPPPGPTLTLDPTALDPNAPVRVVLGPQDDYFTPEGVETFLSAIYTVSGEADRMGYRLSGPAIRHAKGHNIVSDGIVTGSVQVPGGGEPIVMMADRQTTGGYPKIATVISADLRVLAQRRPGQTVRFAAIDVRDAQRLARERAQTIAALPARCRPGRGLPTIEELLTLNLAGAAVDALAEG
jgi:5-oxoprolinase (ATP-hydrolysing) subunit C